MLCHTERFLSKLEMVTPDGKVVFCCQSQKCSQKSIVEGVDLTFADLFPDDGRNNYTPAPKPKSRAREAKPKRKFETLEVTLATPMTSLRGWKKKTRSSSQKPTSLLDFLTSRRIG